MHIIRKISSTVLLIATLLLLMNSILPHHHHEEEVCFTASHCVNDDMHQHESDAHHEGVNHNDHSHAADFCQIIDFYLTVDGKISSGKIKPKSVNKNFSLSAFMSSKEEAVIYSYCTNDNLHNGRQDGLDIKCLTRALRAPPYS